MICLFYNPFRDYRVSLLTLLKEKCFLARLSVFSEHLKWNVFPASNGMFSPTEPEPFKVNKSPVSYYVSQGSVLTVQGAGSRLVETTSVCHAHGRRPTNGEAFSL